MSNRIIILFLLSIPFLFSHCKGSKSIPSSPEIEVETPQTGVKFIKSPTLSDVLDAAEAQNKLVFVDFVADWCLPCKIMDEEVYSHQPTADFINDNFLSYKVDGEKGTGPNLVVVFQVSAYPTLIFMDSKGRVIESKVGAVFHTELVEMGQRALDSRL